MTEKGSGREESARQYERSFVLRIGCGEKRKLGYRLVKEEFVWIDMFLVRVHCVSVMLMHILHFENPRHCSQSTSLAMMNVLLEVKSTTPTEYHKCRFLF